MCTFDKLGCGNGWCGGVEVAGLGCWEPSVQKGGLLAATRCIDNAFVPGNCEWQLLHRMHGGLTPIAFRGRDWCKRTLANTRVTVRHAWLLFCGGVGCFTGDTHP